MELIKRISLMMVIALMFAFPLAPSVFAETGTTAPTEEVKIPVPEFERSSIDYEGMIKFLEDLEAKSEGELEVFTLSEQNYEYGKSQQGRELYVAKIGNGEKKVWVQGRIHGDEPYGTESTLQIIENLVNESDYSYKKLKEELTIYFIPMYNPDGAEMNTRTTIVIDEETGEVVLNEDGKPITVDMNRDWIEERFLASDSIAFYEFWADIKPDFAIDIHHQGPKTMYNSDIPVTMSLGISLAPGGPTLPGIKDGYYDEVTRQALVHIYDALAPYDAINVDRYSVGDGKYVIDIKGGVVSAMMLGLNYKGMNPDGHSNPAVFLETSGNTRNGDIPEDQRENLILQNVIALHSFLYGFATNEFEKVDAERWDDIPHYPFEGYQTDTGIIPVFQDVPNKFWARQYIYSLAGKGAISGYPDGNFGPADEVTRAQFAKIIVDALGLEATNGKTFADTTNHWAKAEIAAAVEHGIVTGYSDQTFGPDDKITREQMALMIVRATDLEVVTNEIPFKDKDKVSSWAQEAVQIAFANNVMNGYTDNTFKPNGKATRAEAAKVIVEAIQ